METAGSSTLSAAANNEQIVRWVIGCSFSREPVGSRLDRLPRHHGIS